ncbi:Beta-mannosidase [Purpureocillium takamizusanense]|uniref:Beta-mannosidase B n=1 Tax=Purpureocillium takamizusanense TaxID=2060973 RepID=A0A9Q8VEE0_9HYPO|nr:Beta-mannosidase [Purpureocillium takamizusanense]UNI21799.1 Beta-mannosidase [Purpureocillium takamizusanense]
MASTSQTLAGWRWRQHGSDGDWNPCSHSRPTTEIFTDLLDAKRIPDPFLDRNERLVQWVGETDWEYECDFVHQPDNDHSRQDLVLEGLDTFATVYLNEQLILISSNMFHRHRVIVTDKLQSGANILRITFRSALREGRALESKHGKLRAFNGDSSRVHVRKAPYHYGWDWGPILLTCGPYREIHLESYSSMAYDVFANPTVSEDLQRCTIDVSWGAALDQDAVVDVTVTSPSKLVFQAQSTLAAHETQGSVSLDIPQPELWHPAGHGPQVFYDVEVQIRSSHGTSLHTSTSHIGIRRLRLVQEPLEGEPGTSFFIEVNNQPVYISGSNWIPDHSFLTALTQEDYKKSVEACLEGNQNMLRIWGGGIYEHDALYAECDRQGVLVWQDFMFACGQYPCYPEFAASVKREAVDQLKRLRQYCSVVIYAGNNEDYQVAEMLKLDWDPNDHSGDWTKSNFPARTIYETILPAVVSEHSPGVPYHPASPWGGNGTEDRTVGDIHQWNVWHGSQEKYQLWDKLTGRFVSEFGMLGFPSAKSVSRFVTDPTQRYPQSAVLDHHNKADGSERRLALYVMENIRADSMRLDSWIYATQLMQAECLASAVRSCRRQWKGPGREYCGGQLIWQINDCWPVSSWSLIDFYGERKLAFFATKRDSAPLALGIGRSTPELKKLKSPPPQLLGPPHDLVDKEYVYDVWAVNTTLQKAAVSVEVRLYDTQTGELRQTISLGNQILGANRSTELAEDCAVDDRTAVQAIMRHSDGSVVSRASDWPQPLKYVTLPTAYDIKLRVLEGRVEISSDAPVKGLELYLADEEREIRWDDNGVDVFPGDTYVVQGAGLVKGDDVRMRYYGSDWVPNRAVPSV